MSPSTVAFPTQVVDTTSAPQTVTVTNTAKTPLTFGISVSTAGDFSASIPSLQPFPGQCVVSGGTAAAAPNGGQCTISVLFTPIASSARGGTLTITDTSKASNNQKVNLAGSGVLATTISPPSVSFGNVTTGTTRTLTNAVTLTNNQTVSLTVTSITSSNPDFAATGCSSTVPANSSCTLTVSFTPRAAAGTSESGTISINHTAVTSPNTFGVSGTSATPPVSFNPASLDFQSVSLGNSSAKGVVITDSGTSSLSFGNPSFTITGPAAPQYSVTDNCGKKLNAGMNCTATVTFRPTIGGTQSATLNVFDNAAGSPQTVPLTGIGTSPLTVAPGTLAFGGVDVATTSSAQLVTITNRQSVPATPLGFSTSIPDFGAVAGGTTPCAGTLAAGQSCTVAVTMTPQQGGLRSGTLSITSNASETPSVSLSGTGTKPLTLDKSTLSFGNVPVATTSATQIVTITNRQNVQVSSLAFHSSISDFSAAPGGATPCTDTLAGGSFCTVAVTMTPTQAGARGGTLSITSTASETPTVSLSGTGTVPLAVVPSTLSFGSIDVASSSASQFVTITNQQTIGVTSLAFSTTGDFSAVAGGITPCTTTLAAGASCTVAVTMTPTQGGSRAGTLSITSSAPGTASVGLSGTGTKPLVLNPTTLSFGNQDVATTSAAQFVTITNKQSIAVSSMAFPTSIADFAAAGGGASSCGGTLGPLTSCTIAVTTTPRQGGLRSGTLTVTSNASEAPTVSLSATGTKPLVLSSSSFSFGTVDVGSTGVAQMLTVTNKQSIPATLSAPTVPTHFVVAAATTCGSVIPASTSCVYAIAMAPTIGGPQSGNFAVNSDTTETPNIVGLSGTGVHPVITVPTTLDFGRVDVASTSVGQQVTVTNKQSVDVTLSFSITNGNFVAQPLSTTCTSTLTAGASCAIAVAFAPTVGDSSTGTLSIAYSGYQSPVNVPLSGVGINPVVVSPTSLDFGNETVASSSAMQTLTITNKQSVPVGLSTPPVSFSGTAPIDYPIDSTTCTASLAGGASCTVTLHFHPTIGGARPATASVNDDAFEHPRLVPLTGIGTTPITITPPAVDFGAGSVGVPTAVQTISLKNNQSVPVTFSLPFAVTGDFTVDAATTSCQATLAAGAQCSIGTRMVATVGGPRAGSLVITSDAYQSPNTVVLSGAGINAVTASTTTLNFGTQVLNTTSVAQTVTLTNHQSVTASLNTSITGDFSASDSCGGTIGALMTCDVSVSFKPTDLGPRGGTATFNNPGGTAISVQLSGTGIAATPPAIVSVSPGAGTIGTVVTNIVVTGNGFTHFAAGSQVSFGAGITVSAPRSVTANSLTVDADIDANAVAGARTVTVTTSLTGGGTETATLSNGFAVSSTASLTLDSISPTAAKQGDTLDVQIVGVGTHFKSGVTFANFGQEVDVTTTPLTIVDQTHATAHVVVSPTATLGWRQVTVTTGGEQASLVPVPPNGPGFLVTASNAAIQSINPATGQQGAAAFQATIVGTGTHFQNGATSVSLGSGVTVTNVAASSATQLTATVLVTGAAATGSHNVVATTGGEVATLLNGFNVSAAAGPALSSVTPTSGQQGATVPLTLVGANTHFTTDAPAPSLTVGSNITVNNLTVVDDATITASLAIDFLAVTGSRTGTLSSGGHDFQFSFTVDPSAAAVTTVTPATVPQGAAATLSLVGTGTHWSQSATTVTFTPQSTCTTAQTTRVTVNSATTATVDITVPADACMGTVPFTVATGGEVLSAGVGIYAHTPTLTVSPSNTRPGTTATINFLGEFTQFRSGSTTATIDGAGVSLGNFVVSNAGKATAVVTVASDALLLGHTITVTTPLGGGASEIVTAPFVVSSTVASLVSIDPPHIVPGAGATVAINGSFTSFANGQTTVSFGPNITVGTPVVANSTQLTVDISADTTAVPGWRAVHVNTGAEQLTIGFHVDGQAAPFLTGLIPSSGAQGQVLSVTIDGVNTNFNSTSQLVAGAGVIVSDFQASGPTSATATLSVLATAPVGPNTMFVISDLPDGSQEVVSGAGLSVTRGSSQITSVMPSVFTQNEIVNVTLQGLGTNWLAGETTLDFGAGITVAQLSVLDSSHISAQIFVQTIASNGFHTVSTSTDGEYVERTQAVVVQQGTATLVSSFPNVGAQNTTFDVQVVGQLTHWQNNVTVASYGTGIVVNSFTVNDSVSGTANVTIDPRAFIDAPGSCHTLTVSTQLDPQTIEQVSLSSQLCVQPGAATLLSVSPNAAPQGNTLTVNLVGQNTNWFTGLTTVSFGDGVLTSNVTVTGPTTASVDLAVSTGASAGFRTAVVQTLGEVASLANAFNVGPNTPTLNGASPSTAQQGQSLTVHLIGQYTHWAQGVTTVTFGEGITVGQITVSPADPSALDVDITIDPIAQTGGRTVTVTTGAEIVSAGVFGVVAGGGQITAVSPQSGNQGQEIVLNVTGQNTHWQQGLTQFSMSGAGGDIRINYVVIDSATSAEVGITISPTANPSARSLYLITGAEALVDSSAFIVTGGIPAVASISPGSARAGDTSVAVEITGLYTHWLSGTTTVDFGPGIAQTASTINSDTSISVVLDVDDAAGLGTRTVTVRNVANNTPQALVGFFQVVSNVPPPPAISYVSPTAGLRGQTFTISISGQNTHWDPTPGATRVDFDPASGITVNEAQVTSPTSLRVNITIAGDAPFGPRTLTIAPGTQGSTTEALQTTFSVIQATPSLTLVDPASGIQGTDITVTVIGSYTGFNDGTTFDFGTGVNVTGVHVFGPTIAQVDLAIDSIASLGTHFVVANTDGRLVGGGGFTVTPSQAVIVSLSPNTARQQDLLNATVVAANTHWTGSTVFSLGAGVDVLSPLVVDATHATFAISVEALASLGIRSLTATTGGEVATLSNAFVVQAGTPLILSSGPSSAPQQGSVTFTIVGQATHWTQGDTGVDVGAGVHVTSVTVTSETSLTASATVDALTATGLRNVTVTTGEQTLVLPNAFIVAAGPAAINLVVPDHIGQGVTGDVSITGVNTHFINTTTQAAFGAGILVNSVIVVSQTSAIVNITTLVNATPGQRTITLTTLGESASIVNGLIVDLTTPSIQFVSPSTGAQGSTFDVTVTGSVTSFDSSTTFDFGAGVVTNGAPTIHSGTSATVNVSVSPVAARTTRDVTATTGAVSATGTGLFTVVAGPAYISAVSPSSGRQDQSGLDVAISGFMTHFTAATPSVSLGPGVTVTKVSVISDTQLTATIDIALTAPTQFNDVVVTTLGEIASLHNGFAVQPIVPITPTITWATPSAITYGTALGAGQLNATASVLGVFTYTPAAGTVLHAGTGQQLSVLFTPADSIRYTTANAGVLIDVSKANLLVTPNDATKIAGTQNPAFTSGFTGFVNSDTPSVVTGTALVATTATTSSTEGSYPITASIGTLSAADYAFSFGTGTLSVTAAAGNGSLLALHVGANVPTSEGFVDRGGSTAQAPVTNDNGYDAWHIAGSGCCSYDYHPVDMASAFAQGWRLTGRVRVVPGSGTGNAYVGLNPAGDHMRFDVVIANQGNDAVISLAGSSLSAIIPGAASQWVQFDLVYDPSTSGATLFVNGVQRVNGYAGWMFANEDRGVMFGVDSVEAGFNLVRFEVATDIIDFEDQPASIPFGSAFPTKYRGITWTNWKHYAPYPPPYHPDGAHAIFGAVDSATMTFTDRPFYGAQFSRDPQATGSIYFELYHQGQLVSTSAPLADNAPELTFLPSGYTGLVDEIRVRSLGSSMTGLGGAWVMDNLRFGRAQVKATPTLTWANPSPITFGTPLSATQLNATADVDGAFTYTPASGAVLQAGLGQQLSVQFVPTDTLHYQNASKNVSIDVGKANQAPLFVIGAPSQAENGMQFTVSAQGGSSPTGTLTFSTSTTPTTCTATPAQGGALITMTAGSGTCEITVTNGGDNNYFPVTSGPVDVTATEPLTATLKVANPVVGIAAGIPSIPGYIVVQLLGGNGSGGPVPAPAGGVPLTIDSSNPACAAVSNMTFQAGATSASIPVSYGGGTTLPCDATVTVTTQNFGSDAAAVRVFRADNSYPVVGSVSYYNPAPVPNPVGALAAREVSLSYYNPAAIPDPTATVATNVSALSYFNPAAVPDPTATVATNVSALSYFNPAQVPDATSTLAARSASLSYYNPASVPDPTSLVAASVVSVSYDNPATGNSSPLQTQPLSSKSTSGDAATTSASTSISVANGPTAADVAPRRLSRTSSTSAVLTIRGANLAGATSVRFVGHEQDVSVGAVSVGADGRELRVGVYVLPSARLGAVNVVVTGPGWSTDETPSMEVEIVP